MPALSSWCNAVVILSIIISAIYHIKITCIQYTNSLVIYIIESVDSISRDERDVPLTQYITNAGIARARYTIQSWCHRKFCRPEILSRRRFFLGNSVAATIFPRRFCRSILTQRLHFLGNFVALLHRDTLPRSTAEFYIGGGTRGDWGPVPPLMSREEAASYIGNAVAALK